MKLQDILNTKTFLEGQYTLYRIEFSKTNNREYLKNMNDFNDAMNVFRYFDEALHQLVKEKNELKKENDKLRKMNGL